MACFFSAMSCESINSRTYYGIGDTIQRIYDQRYKNLHLNSIYRRLPSKV